ncbi:YggS family pyridoxal phosphate-dependent enzyme [Leifsonia bigeumensis]|uniref:Pyridoxal phosphate homeostasis protein n=1 Tax=Leifsonella bigeumensis TaxID=433643 RepID=A0ABP7FPT7_9MICO
MTRQVGPPLAERLATVRSGVAEAAREAGRSPQELTTIVVTKFHPASLVRELHALGVQDVGESRHQEARQKSAELAPLRLTWHFVGQLQGKKARQVAAYADVIHSVDRESLVTALRSDDSVTDCFLQLNLTDDPERGGVDLAGLPTLAELVLATPGLRLLGVMAIAPLDEEPRRAFARVRTASEALRTVAPDATAISAGMSGDYREAILEGATHLRIGTAITGNRPIAG